MNSERHTGIGIIELVIGAEEGRLPEIFPVINFNDNDIVIIHPVLGALDSSDAGDETAAAIGVLGLLVHEHDKIVDKNRSIVVEINSLVKQASRRFTVDSLLGRPRTEPQQIDTKEAELKVLAAKIGVLDTALKHLSGLVFQLDQGVIDATVFDIAVSRLGLDYLEIQPIAVSVRQSGSYDNEGETIV